MNEIEILKNQLLNLDKKELIELNLKFLTDLKEKDDKLKTWNKITDSENWIDFSRAAKDLNEEDKKYKFIGRNILFSILRDNKILRNNNEAYQAYIDRGYFKQIETDQFNKFGKHKIIPKTVISAKGIDFIKGIIDEYITNK